MKKRIFTICSAFQLVYSINFMNCFKITFSPIQDIKVFLPAWRKESSKPDNPKTGGAILEKLEKDNVLAYTPSRQVLGKRIQCHDDRLGS